MSDPITAGATTTISPIKQTPSVPVTSPATSSAQADFERTTITVDAGGGRKRHVPSMLTRKGMETVLLRGQSVMYGDRIITDPRQLPTDSELAITSGDNSEVDRVRKEKQAQIDALNAEIRTLKSTPAKPAETVKVPEAMPGK